MSAASQSIASLPMYDFAYLRPATDAWWQGLARHMHRSGIDGTPTTLTRKGDASTLWCHPDLVFSQTCGYPFTQALAGYLTLLATPSYAVEGCGTGTYSSALVTQRHSGLSKLSQLQGKIAACNAPDSMSGMLALALCVAESSPTRPFFSKIIWSSAHRQSAILVASGKADIAAIDAVTLALLRREIPEITDALETIGWSPKVPGLPYVTASVHSDEQVKRMQTALFAAAGDPDLAPIRLSLLIESIEFLPVETYDIIPRYKQQAFDSGILKEFGIT